ncbi:hypothetical protein HDU96_001250 [Phlyctochytrium bullatum]|nr:hypothetical protein HDU96_001250 [Phlyctochytrium bullatum]
MGQAPSLPIGLALPGVSDAEWVSGIRELLNFRMTQLRTNTSLHPSVRNLSLIYDEIPVVGESYAIRSAFSLLGKSVAATIGTGYSSMTKALVPVLQAYNVPVCCGASTSPTLSDRNNYNNFFRPVPQDNLQAFAMVDFILQQGWSEVAILASQDGYGQNLANAMTELMRKRMITITARDNFFPGLTDYTKSLLNIKDSLSRIIVYCGNSAEFVVMARQATALGIYGPGYAWITSDGAKYGLEGRSAQELSFINGAINVFPEEGKGAVYEQFKKDFSNADKFLYPSSASDIQPYLLFYVNCLESFVFGYDRILKANPSLIPAPGRPWNFSLYEYNIPGIFNFPERDTVTGPVNYDNATGDRLGSYSLAYYDAAISKWTYFASYDSNGVRVFANIRYAGGSTSRPFGSLAEAAQKTVISPPNPAAILIFVFSAIFMSLCAGMGAFLLAFQGKKYIKAISVEFSLMIISGLFILSFYPLFLTGEPGRGTCVAEIWILPGSVTLAIGSLLAKHFRVYKVFSNKFVGLTIGNVQVMMWIAGIMTLSLILSLVWTVFDAPYVQYNLVRFGSFAELQSICSSEKSRTQDAFLGTEYAFFALLFVLGIALAAFTEHLPPEYNQSAEIRSTVYSFAASGIAVIVLLNVVKFEKTAQVIIKALGSYAAVGFGLYNLFGGKVRQVLKDMSTEKGVATDSLVRKRSSAVPSTNGVASEGGESETGSVGGGSVSDPNDKGQDLKLVKKLFPVADVCYLREKTNLGVVTWTPYIVAIPPSDATSIYLLAGRGMINAIILFSVDWLVSAADRDPSVPKREPYHAIKLVKNKQSVVTRQDLVMRFKEAAKATEWLNILTSRIKNLPTGSINGTPAGTVGRRTTLNG